MTNIEYGVIALRFQDTARAKLVLAQEKDGCWKVLNGTGEVMTAGTEELWEIAAGTADVGSVGRLSLDEDAGDKEIGEGLAGAFAEWCSTGPSPSWVVPPSALLSNDVVDPAWLELQASAALERDGAGTAPKSPPAAAKPVKPVKAAKAVKVRRGDPTPIPVADMGGEVYYPEWMVKPSPGCPNGVSDIDYLELMRSMQKHILVLGPPGTGKTMSAMAASGPGVHTVSFTPDTDLSALQGQTELTEKGTHTSLSAVRMAMEHRHSDECDMPCGKSTLIADELNLAPSALVAFLHGALDSRRTMTLPGGLEVKAGPSFMVIAGINPSEGEVAAPLLSRFTILEKGVNWSAMQRSKMDPRVLAVGRALHDLEANGDLLDPAPSVRVMKDVDAHLTQMVPMAGESAGTRLAVGGFITGRNETDVAAITDVVAGAFQLSASQIRPRGLEAF